MREGELPGLRWSDLDFIKGIVRVERTLTYVTGHGFIEGKPKTARSKRKIVLPQVQSRRQEMSEVSAKCSTCDMLEVYTSYGAD